MLYFKETLRSIFDLEHDLEHNLGKQWANDRLFNTQNDILGTFPRF